VKMVTEGQRMGTFFGSGKYGRIRRNNGGKGS
jgi:hypothetical protein